MLSSGAVPTADASPAWQAKTDLYREVYRPFAASWFRALATSSLVGDLLSRATGRDLPAVLAELDQAFRGLVSGSLTGEMVAEVQRLREHVLWVGDEESPAGRSDAGTIRRSLTEKLKRNVSLAVLEALLCLESARRYGIEELGLRGPALIGLLRRSRQLYTSLAVLHDSRERDRVMQLTGRTEPVEYPQVTFDDVLSGSVRIPADRLMVGGTAEEPQLRFVIRHEKRVTLSTPTMQCPAHAHAPGSDGGTINDALWDVLISAFERSGKFEPLRG